MNAKNPKKISLAILPQLMKEESEKKEEKKEKKNSAKTYRTSDEGHPMKCPN